MSDDQPAQQVQSPAENGPVLDQQPTPGPSSALKRTRDDADLSDEPPRKSSFASDSTADPSGENAEPSSSKAKRGLRFSPDYFFEDGNIVLLVHDTFFKVHRSRLCTDGSIFSTMFSLPQDTRDGAEGSSISNPIGFADKPRRFTALLWALYALPADLRSVGDSAENCLKLIDIATAAQKYAFKSTEDWAISCLVDLVKKSNSISERTINPWRIFTLATLCSSEALRMAMIRKIIDRAAAGKLSYAWVITIAENLKIPELLGEGYYRLVIKDPDNWNEEGKLTEPMMSKLYVGFCKLVTFRDSLVSHPFPIVEHNCPVGPNACRARWNLLWKDCSDHNTLPSVDVLGHLRVFVKYLKHCPTNYGECLVAFTSSTEEKLKELNNGPRLYEFFQ